jgi:small subunit ribosomal protein S29
VYLYPRCNILQETVIMVRDPALQIINCIKNSDLSNPAVRYLVYGRPGCGKSITLAHLTHFGHQEGFITLTMSQVGLD